MLTLRRSAALLFLLAWLVGPVAAQTPTTAQQTLIIFPFENSSNAPGLAWIGESFPEVMGERLSSASLYVIGREDRLRAYDQIGIPAEAYPSRATLYRIAEQMGADYVVLGRYNFDGKTFSATVQLLDMQRLHLSRELGESGPLLELIDIETALAWDVLHELRPDLGITRQAFQAGATAIRLDALENYVRGITATSPAEKIQHFREAVRIAPGYTEALLQLGKACYAQRQYDQAVSWLERISRNEPAAREANFYLGLAAYYRGDFAKSESALLFLASQLPLPEVYNNLGAAAFRRGDKNALEYFQKAVHADPNDADYRFNLGLAYSRSGDLASASRQFQEVLSLRPADHDAKSLLNTTAGNAASRPSPSALPNSAVPTTMPLPRMKRNYDESSFRQLALEIQATAEQRLAKTDPHTHAQFHVTRGHELLGQGFAAEAESEFREAISLDPANAEAHSGLARVFEARQDAVAARSEANAALAIRPSVESLLVLARLDLRDNKTDRAAESVDRALQLEPANASALALKRTIAAKLAEKAQPLPNR